MEMKTNLVNEYVNLSFDIHRTYSRSCGTLQAILDMILYDKMTIEQAKRALENGIAEMKTKAEETV